MNEETSYGVSVLFDDKDKIMSKTLIASDYKELGFLFDKKFTQEQADKIKKGMSYDDVKKLLGCDGVETSQTQISFADNKIAKICIWVNKDGSKIQDVIGTDGTANDASFFD